MDDGSKMMLMFVIILLCVWSMVDQSERRTTVGHGFSTSVRAKTPSGGRERICMRRGTILQESLSNMPSRSMTAGGMEGRPAPPQPLVPVRLA
jgi:hypothetical protein